jgi:Serpin (serine protease inhibitor)
MAGLRAWLNKVLRKEGISTLDLPHSRYDPLGPGAFGHDNNRLALGLYALLRSQPGNLFFSPFSIRTVLAMAYAGAIGETGARTKEALHFSQFTELLHGEPLTVPLRHQQRTIHYVQATGFQVVDLDYQGDALSARVAARQEGRPKRS